MSTERELGEHSIAIEHMQRDIDDLMKDMKDVKQKIDKIDKAMDEIKGGWKVIIWIAAGIGAFISYIVAHWMK